MQHHRLARTPEAYRLPEGLGEERFERVPLYMLVAWWLLRRGAPATVRDVCDAFGISPRRAGDIFLYLHSNEKITCQRLWLTTPSGKRSRGLTVTSVGTAPARKGRGPVRRMSRKGTSSREARDLRRWVASRRVGDAVPDEFGLQGDG
ncbi:CaiF/GrlA family transcriptional regulator [Salmonella enterica]|nr:CaiF/GrlA family transcriptional regulator [Salmonella enterica]EJF5595121.1 CaiF/GrlA family transcriptional regulator [Salmonella enterica]EJF5826250.1 CaiF/GrlA family transcriptional regulator [Salmonella enterica]EJF5844909.1 CaiF/GrlA family transcriptional regulator [Salmonella enterica]EJF5917399.1 CaiF/GrlA family transcriptional regulator [Salmonella enterica]